ncbi:copper resistance protein NlpE N-terminal domain-containing protein [Flavobacterium sp.]|uniref:copper resistance protein NlpE N-terminal domain-containing protein n=1 Tax=Flavobacterium sp. TaxID=239 RepID=UPI003340A8A0
MRYLISLLFTLAFTFFSCTSKEAKPEPSPQTNPKVTSAKQTLDYLGVYKGVFPCADCEGIETQLELQDTTHFVLTTRYLGKSDTPFVVCGTYGWNANETQIQLDNQKTGPYAYAVLEGVLQQLDLQGKPITGDLASRNRLTKMKKDAQTGELLVAKEATVVKGTTPAAPVTFALAGTEWRLHTLLKKKIQSSKKPFTLTLMSKDARFTAYMGCNQIGGQYIMPSVDGLAFTAIISTKMACPDDQVEAAFVKMLSQVDAYSIQKDQLQLRQGKTVLAQFTAAK